jgi:hypothetical protein
MEKTNLTKVKLPKETLEEINKVGERQLKKLFSSEEDFKGLENPLFETSKEREEKEKEEFKEIYRNLLDVFKKYCDWKNSYYPIVVCWCIGTYFHQCMLTYPYLYFNASKESGKSRSVRLITYISNNGEMVGSMTEAVLFRTKGTLGIDEFEKISRKGNENLIELLNSAYKKGLSIKRMKKVKTPTGEEQVVENFSIFRPLVLANIWGIDNVLEDRVLPLYLEKTTSDFIPNLLEIWEFDDKISQIKRLLTQKCSLCNVVSYQSVYVDWNEYIVSNYNTVGTNNYIRLHLFKKIRESGLKGRMLELSFPLILVADMIDEEVVDTLINSLKEINIEKSHEAFLENKDILLLDMVSQEIYNNFQSIRSITQKFREFTQCNEEWVNEKWVGRALKRLLLTKEKKRTEKGIEVILDIIKAQEKIRMYK